MNHRISDDKLNHWMSLGIKKPIKIADHNWGLYQFLEGERVLGLFIDNYLEQRSSLGMDGEKIDRLYVLQIIYDNRHSSRGIQKPDYSFKWAQSPESYQFWSRINDRWVKLCNEQNQLKEHENDKTNN